MQQKVSFHVDQAFRVLFGIGVALVCLSLLVQVCVLKWGIPVDRQFARLVDLDREANFPTFYSAALMAIIAVTCTVIARLDVNSRHLHWRVLSVGFVIMSIDEICSLHESLVLPVRGMLSVEFQAWFHFAWILPAVVLVIAIAIYFLKFLASLPQAYAKLFVLSGALFLGAAVGIEFIEGRYVALHGRQNLVYAILMDIEETSELAGLLLFLRSLWHYLALIAPQWHVSTVTAESPPHSRSRVSSAGLGLPTPV